MAELTLDRDSRAAISRWLLESAFSAVSQGMPSHEWRALKPVIAAGQLIKLSDTGLASVYETAVYHINKQS